MKPPTFDQMRAAYELLFEIEAIAGCVGVVSGKPAAVQRLAEIMRRPTDADRNSVTLLDHV